jgi:hypothetical protein
MQIRIAPTLLLATAFLLAGIACSNQKKVALRFVADYEQVQGWFDVPLEAGVAHSGRFSHKVERNQEFSHGFALPLAQLDTAAWQTVTATAWVNCIDMTDPVLFTLDLMIPSENEHLQTVYYNIQSDVNRQPGIWQKVSVQMKVPNERRTEGAVLKAYFWNNRQQQFWIDDFTLTLQP